MSNFDESKVKRQSDGKFACKNAGVPAVGLKTSRNDDEGTDMWKAIYKEPLGQPSEPDPTLRMEQAESADLSLDEQIAFAKDPSPGVRYCLMLNPVVGDDIRAVMIQDEMPGVAAAAVEHMSDEKKAKYTQSPDLAVRLGVSKTDNQEILWQMRDDENPNVRAQVAERIAYDKLDFFTHDTAQTVQDVIAKRRKEHSPISRIKRLFS
ncbi:hypothetical protein [Actinomyces vulturis]|uniref:hypothetical protein n=1 Tax=Actinomyces vulturis TaxID=1857645 RepID=UPI000834EA20|nr:hypothetical protein [Actinomyces vulturis]